MNSLKIIREHLSVLGVFKNDYLFENAFEKFKSKDVLSIDKFLIIDFFKAGNESSLFRGSIRVKEHFLSLFGLDLNIFDILINRYKNEFEKYDLIDYFFKINNRYYKEELIEITSYAASFNTIVNNKGFNSLPLIDLEIYFKHLNLNEPVIEVVIRFPVGQNKFFYYKYEKPLLENGIHYISSINEINNIDLKNIDFRIFDINDFEEILKNDFIRFLYINIINFNLIKDDKNNEIMVDENVNFELLKHKYKIIRMLDY